jgi:hypothetical protein
MGEHGIMTGWQQFGLVGLLSGSGTILLFLVVKWTLATTKDILNQAAHERVVFSEMQKTWIEAINQHTRQAETFHDTVKTTAEYQRKEHMEMIKTLEKLDDRTRSCLIPGSVK